MLTLYQLACTELSEKHRLPLCYRSTTSLEEGAQSIIEIERGGQKGSRTTTCKAVTVWNWSWFSADLVCDDSLFPEPYFVFC